MSEPTKALRIALLGTRGIPARYGGFETAVEEIGQRLARRGHDVVVYCRSQRTGPVSDATYLGMRLVHLPAVHRRTLETLSHTGLSAAHLLAHRTDVAILFNAGNSPWLPLIRAARIPVATHVDGLEWRRAKWGRFGRRYYRTAEAFAVQWSDALIADAKGIQAHYLARYGAASELIAYGAPILDGVGSGRLQSVGLEPQGYHLVVSRFEPENHVDMIVDGFARSAASRPLVVVGSAPYADRYTRLIHSVADDRVRFLGPIWDQKLLDQLYAGAITYLHGHSVGGTNPSLLRAIGAGAPTAAFDVSFNREVLGDAGSYFRDPEGVATQVGYAESHPATMRSRGDAARLAAGAYDWDDVASAYERLCEGLADGSVARPLERRRRRRIADAPTP